jgi:hypothetical protein
MKFLLTIGLAGALAALPSLALAQQDRPRQSNQDEPGDVAEAIRFQKAEEAAAARQERIDAGRERDNSADREMTKTRTKARSTRPTTTRKTPPPQPENH